MNKKQTFGAAVRELRKEAGLTLRELAEKVNVDFTYLSKIENGTLPPPSQKVIQLLAETLNADKDELFSLAGIIPPDIADILKDRRAREQLRARAQEEAAGQDGEDIPQPEDSRNAAPAAKARKTLARAAVAVILAILVGVSLWLAVPTTDTAVSANNEGVTYNEQGQYDKAIAAFNKALELDPNLALAYSNRAWTYIELRQYGQAIDDCNKALELDPKLALAYNNRGLAYIRLDQYQQGVNDCTKAIQLDPRLALAYSNRGLAYAELGQYDNAIADFDKAVTIDPSLQK